MARDYTKYNVKGVGEKLNKRQLVFEVVKNWVTKKKPSLKVMTNTFSDEIQGSKGFIKKKAEVKDPKRFNMQEPLSIKNGTKVVVSNQWGTKNIAAFLELAKKLGYKIEAVEAVAPKKAAAPAKSPLTEEQIAEYKEREKDDIEGDYEANSYYAFRMHDDLVEDGDIAWADTILQKIVDASKDFRTIETACEKLQEREEMDRFWAMVSKAEAIAEDTSDLNSLADVVEESDSAKSEPIRKKAEDKAESVGDLINVAEKVQDNNKDWATKIYKKAEGKVDNLYETNSLAEAVKEIDEDWSIKIYKKSEAICDSTADYIRLADVIIEFDKDWARELLVKAEEDPGYFSDFKDLGYAYGNPDGLANKEKAAEYFEKAFPKIDDQWDKDNLLDAAKECLGMKHAFTQKMIAFVDEAKPKLKLPKQYFPDYKLAWGKKITLHLENGPSCESIEYFDIQLNMETNEVIGHDDKDDALSRWFDSWEVGIYDGYVEEQSYDGTVRIWGEDENGEEWCVYGHNEFEDVEEGELPNGATGEDIWDALGGGKAIYELYQYVKTNGE